MKVFHILEIITFHDSVKSIDASFDHSPFFDFACLHGRKTYKTFNYILNLIHFNLLKWNDRPLLKENLNSRQEEELM